jgi:hypothetical protein
VRRVASVAVLLLFALASPAAADGVDVTHADTARELADVDIAAVARTAQAAAEPQVAAADEALPMSWSCSELASDNTANAKFSAALPQIHVAYAYAGTDDFASWKNRLQGDVSVVQRFLSSQSGGRKALRFDMGTSCSTQEVDITAVPLLQARSYYLDNFSRVEHDVRAALPGLPANWDLMIVADNLTTEPSGWRGQGEVYDQNDRPDADNPNNHGGLTSILWAPSGAPRDSRDSTVWWPDGFLHELTHNMGGVQSTAPHHTDYGHCWDEHDVMCYDDGSGIAMANVCPTVSGAIAEVYDCGNDDYFSPVPAAGNYLATHWNVYNSAFMVGCATLVPACGGAGGPTPIPPVNSVPPGITGTPAVGQTVFASHGSWINDPTSYAYGWERESAFGWSAIAGATGAAYTPTAADAGLRLRVVVTATNADGSVVAASDPTAGVSVPAAPPTAPAHTPAPRELTTGSAWLTVTAGSPRGKRLARVAFSAPAAGRVTTRALRIRRPSGSYVVRLCTTGSRPACTTRTLRARAGRLALPALTLRHASGSRVRVTLSVTARSRRATAVTRGPVALDV